MKTRIAINFMKQKGEEYKQLKSEVRVQQSKILDKDLL